LHVASFNITILHGKTFDLSSRPKYIAASFAAVNLVMFSTYYPTQIRYFGDILPSQSLGGLVLKK